MLPSGVLLVRIDQFWFQWTLSNLLRSVYIDQRIATQLFVLAAFLLCLLASVVSDCVIALSVSLCYLSLSLAQSYLCLSLSLSLSLVSFAFLLSLFLSFSLSLSLFVCTLLSTLYAPSQLNSSFSLLSYSTCFMSLSLLSLHAPDLLSTTFVHFVMKYLFF